MASGTSVDFHVVESIVESVYNSKLPDFIEVMEEARANSLGRFDAKALRLEEEILRVARQLKSHCRRIARE